MSQLTRVPAALALCLAVTGSAAAQEATMPFDPRAALCDRQTFRLGSVWEVHDWLDYLRGLRTGRTLPPDAETCPGGTLASVYDILSSPDRETAKTRLAALLTLHVSAALDPVSSSDAPDQANDFRYLNDLTAASFLWLLCPERGETKAGCVTEMALQLPEAFRRSSPVFCDFADPPLAPEEYAELEIPLADGPAPPVCIASENCWRLEDDLLPGLCHGPVDHLPGETGAALWLNKFEIHMRW